MYSQLTRSAGLADEVDIGAYDLIYVSDAMGHYLLRAIFYFRIADRLRGMTRLPIGLRVSYSRLDLVGVYALPCNVVLATKRNADVCEVIVM